MDFLVLTGQIILKLKSFYWFFATCFEHAHYLIPIHIRMELYKYMAVVSHNHFANSVCIFNGPNYIVQRQVVCMLYKIIIFNHICNFNYTVLLPFFWGINKANVFIPIFPVQGNNSFF